MTEVTRLEVLQDAKKIAIEQGAVRHPSNFWEDADGHEVMGDSSGDPGNCRVCVCGAIYLAEVRAGLQRGWFYGLNDVYNAMDEVYADRSDDPSAFGLKAIVDNPAEIVRVLDRMIEREQEKVVA